MRSGTRCPGYEPPNFVSRKLDGMGGPGFADPRIGGHSFHEHDGFNENLGKNKTNQTIIQR